MRDDRPTLLTAAHVIDENKHTSLYIGGRTEVLPIEFTFSATKPPPGGRAEDSIDIAFATLDAIFLRRLGDLPFIPMAAQRSEPGQEAGRVLMPFGYPYSRNKTPHQGKTRLKLQSWSYTGLAASPSSAAKRAGAGAWNIFIAYGKTARDEEGRIVRTNPPKGVSGGAIFDLGDAADVEALAGGKPVAPALVGVFIEHCPEDATLVGTKLSALTAAEQMA